MCSHILTVLFIFVLTVSAFPQGRRPLFRLKEPPAARSDKSSIASVRESEIAVSPEAADSAAVTLPLFDGRSYEAHVEKREARGRDEVFWAGKIRTEAFEGDVILNYKRGFLTGLIYAPAAVYEIPPLQRQA